MIPKVIHYCWFGGNPLPELARKCIASWKRFCPDYEIVEWNESNFDIHCCDYVREAYEAKKWAFVSDYARFQILYRHGGLYFDTDVEVLKPLDAILEQGGFMGMESCPTEADPARPLGVNPGIGLAAEPGNELYRQLLEGYHTRHFRKEDGSLDLTTIVDYTTELLRAHGLQPESRIQCIDGIRIYPKEYFCPMDNITGVTQITENSHSIHYFDASWLSDEKKYEERLMQKLRKHLPVRLARYSAQFLSIAKHRGIGAALSEIAAWVRKKTG